MAGDYTLADLDALLEGATPGDWHVEDDSADLDDYSFAEETWPYMLHPHGAAEFCELSHEDARLMAAAPALAAQLRRVTVERDRLASTLSTLAGIIARDGWDVDTPPAPDDLPDALRKMVQTWEQTVAAACDERDYLRLALLCEQGETHDPLTGEPLPWTVAGWTKTRGTETPWSWWADVGDGVKAEVSPGRHGCLATMQASTKSLRGLPPLVGVPDAK